MTRECVTIFLSVYLLRQVCSVLFIMLSLCIYHNDNKQNKKVYIVLLIINNHFHFFIQISILSAYTIACNASIQTINRVTTCPSNNSYEAAVAKKDCSSLAADAQVCSSFQYHCVLSDDKKNAIEVCAPSINIIGKIWFDFMQYSKLRAKLNLSDNFQSGLSRSVCQCVCPSIRLLTVSSFDFFSQINLSI